MGVVVGGLLALEVGEEIVAEVELDLSRGSDDDLAVDVKEDGGDGGEADEADGVVENFLLRDAVAHVVDGVADDERNQNLGDVIGNDSNPSPGEMLPVAPEVGV